MLATFRYPPELIDYFAHGCYESSASDVNTLQSIAVRAAERKLHFLLAGGHAVVVHGHPRNTFDLDLIIRRDDRSRWSLLATDLGYRLYNEGPTFLQFSAPNTELLPLDLMLVNQATFDKLRADAVPVGDSNNQPKTVSLRHLLALKCHAIKHGHPGRVEKDVDDVIHLVRAFSQEAAFELCEQYARQFPKAMRQHQSLGRHKCIVPFNLGPE